MRRPHFTEPSTAGGVPVLTSSPTVSDALINAANNSSYNYVIGPISSSDGGLTWTAGSGAVISPAAGWESSYVKDPALIWDGSQYVVYYCGFNGTTFKIGRATASSVSGTWTKYGSNPVLSTGAGGSPDEAGCTFPFVIYDPGLSPAWKMWYQAFPFGTSPGSPAGSKICFADSSDGITWTKRGVVIGLGSAGDLDDSGLVMGAAIRVGATYYVHYSGFRTATNFYKSMVATCTDPADAGTYTKLGALSGFSSTLSLGSFTFRSNQVRSIVLSNGQYLVGGTGWNSSGAPEEGGWATVASSPTSVTVPSGLIVPLDDASWHANSAENPAYVSH